MNQARKALRDLLILAIGAAVLSGVYALLQLAVYGHVRW